MKKLMKKLGCKRVKCISTNYNQKIEAYYRLFNHDMTYVTVILHKKLHKKTYTMHLRNFAWLEI